MNPAEVIFWIDPKVSNTVVPYKFRRPPSVTANGLYQFRGGKNTRLEVKVEGANGMDYVFLGKHCPLIASPRDCCSPTTDCKSLIFVARFSQARCVETQIFTCEK